MQQLICTIRCFLIEIVLSIHFEWPQSVFLALLHSNHSADELGGTWNSKGLRFCVKGKATRSYNDLLSRISAVCVQVSSVIPTVALQTLLITSGCWVLVFGKDCELSCYLFNKSIKKQINSHIKTDLAFRKKKCQTEKDPSHWRNCNQQNNFIWMDP